MRRATFAGVPVAMLGLIAAIAACKPGESSHLKADGPATIYVMLSDEPHATNANAYRLLAHAPAGMAEGSVNFCLGTAAACTSTAEKPVIVPGVLTPKGDLKFFSSRDYVHLKAEIDALDVTVTGKDNAGAAVTQSVRLKRKGVTAPGATTATGNGGTAASPCYRAPDEFTCKAEIEVVRLTNEKRAAASKTAVTYDQKIGFVSRLWATEQYRVSKVSREWLDTGVWGQKYNQEFNVTAPVIAEAYGMAATSGATIETVAKAVFDVLWANPEFQTIMTGDYKLVGVGLARGSAGWYVSQDFAK